MTKMYTLKRDLGGFGVGGGSFDRFDPLGYGLELEVFVIFIDLILIKYNCCCSVI